MDRQIKVYTREGIRTETVYDIGSLNYLGILLNSKEYKKRGISYLNIPCAFDIETTNISEAMAKELGYGERAFAFMYQWQFCIIDQVVFGRTWAEFQKLINTLQRAMDLSDKNRLVIYVHNLAFEFQFFRRFIPITGGFFREKYKPLTVVSGGIEFRDSYTLTNMSLDKFLQQENAVYQKNDKQKFDYSKIRTPETKLSEYEESYCYCDVRGLCEGIQRLLDQDDIAHIPLTSTGYVRRDLRTSMRKNKKNRQTFTNIKLNKDLYEECKAAFRGGDTHANLLYSGQIVENVESRDISSSYPASMMINLYPSSKFERIDGHTYLNYDLSGYAVLLSVRMINAKYIGNNGNPYLPLSRCRSIAHNRVVDNGRILYSEGIEIDGITDIDLEIIKHEYSYDDIFYNNIYISRYAPLPDEFKDTVMDYFRKKTLLKGGTAEDQYYYMKSKNKLNSCYGCMVTDICQSSVEYENGEYIEIQEDKQKLLDKYYRSRNSFLSYQHGVWVTAHSRMRLRRAMWDIVGSDMVYCDTDSIKYINDHTSGFEELNKKLQKEAIDHGAYAPDREGNIHYMGVWEYDGHADRFKTLGAKKYLVEESGKVKSTIAGVSKAAGSIFYSKMGIEEFKVGSVIDDAGHLVAYYNDDDIHTINIQNVDIVTASNVALIEGGYTVGVTNEYAELIQMILDNGEIIY